MTLQTRAYLFITAGLLCGAAFADTTIERTFTGVTSVQLNVGSADAVVRPSGSSEATVTIVHTYDEEDYTPRLEQRGSRLVLKEKFADHWQIRGHATWTLTIPDGIELSANAGSGDLEVEDLTVDVDAGLGSGDVTLHRIKGRIRISEGSGDMELRDITGEVSFTEGSGDVEVSGLEGPLRGTTGSGDITLKRISGEVRLTGGSGDFDLDDVAGEFRLTNGSGEISARDIHLFGRSSFRSGSGDVVLRALRASGSADLSSGSGNAEVALAAAPEGDLNLTSGSGDAIVDFDGQEINGDFVLRADKKRGRIKAPFAFDREYEEPRGRHATMIKEARVGSGSPAISIETGSGTAAVSR